VRRREKKEGKCKCKDDAGLYVGDVARIEEGGGEVGR